MKDISLINIFKIFFKIGAILLGGGYVIVPIMNEELVEKRNWITQEEVCDYYCVSQCLPGIIAINMAILVGYKLKKINGVIVSVFAMVLSPMLSIILLALILENITKLPFIESVFYGVNLSVIILIYLAIKDIWKISLIDKFCTFWFLLILVLSLLKINPVYLIIFSIIFGIFLQKIRDNSGDNKC